MRRQLSLIFIGFLSLLLTACGGGGSSGGGSDSFVLSGTVEDGPIADARIALLDADGALVTRCGSSGTAPCQAISATDGSFSLQLAAGTDLTTLELVAVGGSDRDTGVDFAQIRLRAPLALFLGREDEIVLSPLTSILAGRKEGGLSLALSEEQVLRWLGLRPGLSAALRPAADPALAPPALLLTGIALEMAQLGNADPFRTIGNQFDPAQPLFSGDTLNSAALQALGLPAAAEERIGELAAAVRGSGGSAAATFQRILFRQGLLSICERLLAEESGFDPADTRLLANLDLLAEEILAAAGTTRIPLGSGVTPQRIARYVFFTYDLTTYPRLTADATTFRAALQHPGTGRPLREDAQIAELATLKTVYAASVPLLDDEIPGNDNRRRLEYFYNSDRSPFYLAEKVNAEILDDAFSDAVMLKIARGKAEAGLFAEAEAIVETQIYQTEIRGDGYYELADVLIAAGRPAEAIEALGMAQACFHQVIAAKGFANIKSLDIQRLQIVASAFRRAGDLPAALAETNYLAAMAPYLTTTVLYGNVIVGTRNVAEDYLADGEVALATPLVEFMHTFARTSPANVSGGVATSYQAKVYYLVETARLFTELGRFDKVAEIYAEIAGIRKNDGLQNKTAAATWTYMDDCVELLYRSGLQAQAYSLADDPAMPAAEVLTAFKKIATFEALQNGLPAALAILDARIPLPTDRIEALTYFANNKNREYIALALINRNILTTARQALDLAAAEMIRLSPATDLDRYQQMIQRGYVKIADLYALAGAPQQAGNLLRQAEDALATLTGVSYRIDGLIDIGKGYYALGDPGQAGAFLDRAGRELTAAVAGVVTTGTAAERSKVYQDLALLYERLLDACLATESPDRAAGLIPAYLAVARAIFDPQAAYADKDKIAGAEVETLLKAADYLRRAGDFTDVDLLLTEAETVAGQIAVAATRHNRIIEIIAAHAAADQFEAALSLARSFSHSLDRYRALQSIAMTLAERDDFPQATVAGIDSDHDGRPDFFHPLATAAEISAAGLVLDTDCDNDGIPDSADRRPLVYDSQRS